MDSYKLSLTVKSTRLLQITFLLLLVVILGNLELASGIPISYNARRSVIIQTDENMEMGGRGCNMTNDEKIVNNYIMSEKQSIIEKSRKNKTAFAASKSFLDVGAREEMRQTKAYKVIEAMPKGGALHLHDSAITSLDWIVKNVTYRDNLFMCGTTQQNFKFHFYQTPPAATDDCTWRSVKEARASASNSDEFDKVLFKSFTMVTDDPVQSYPDITSAWTRFENYFGKVGGLVFYVGVFKDYVRQGMLEFMQDNVQYMEVRALIPKVYELDGTTHDPTWTLAAYKEVIKEFERDHPQFSGVRIIKASLRFFPKEQVLEDVKQAMAMYQADPEFVVGFDLVGQEDPLKPLIDYIDALLYPSQQNPPVYLPYYFHAGETNWDETKTDVNLFDAFLLNTTRIGHGYALLKHPYLKKLTLKRDIPLEINPISNQVLKLVDDLRNHPVSMLIAENYPVVISSDDPVVWEAKPLTDDFYLAFMTALGEQTGLSTLKQLIYNSLKYSALTGTEKTAAINLWEAKWNKFIRDFAAKIKSDTV